MDILNLVKNFMKKDKKKEKTNDSLIKELFDDPDNFILQAEVEEDEIIITFTRKYKKTVKKETTKKKDLQTKIRETTNRLKGEKL